MPRIVEPTEKTIAEAAALLHTGGVVVLPTETVYGLAADTFNIRALRRVYELKGRPPGKPLSALVLNEQQAQRLSSPADERRRELIERFWPGPLTLVVPKAMEVPREATAGCDTIAIRAPDHPVARRLIEAFGGPLSAPSANRSGRISPTRASHVADDYADSPFADDLLILDGGLCAVGLESTVLELPPSGTPRILRPGTITAEQLRAVIGEVDEPETMATGVLPGETSRHYAPRTTAELVSTENLPQRLQEIGKTCVVLGFAGTGVGPSHHFISMPLQPESYASSLYESLRRADAMRCIRILIVAPPEPEDNDNWKAVRDRLRRVTAPGNRE